jgi:hypothetical protein
MCVGCFVVSAFTLFMPATDAGAPLPVEVFSNPTPGQTQSQDLTTVRELRQAVQDMQAAASRQDDTQVIVATLADLADRLAPVTQLDTAEQMVDEGLDTLKENILAAPNAEQLMEVMYHIREQRYQKLQGFQPRSSGVLSQWGWLG